MASSPNPPRLGLADPGGAPQLLAVGRKLWQLGLTSAAIRHALGLSHPIPGRATVGDLSVPAAQLAHLFVGGARLPAADVRGRLGETWQPLVDCGAVAIDGDDAVARLCIVPVADHRFAACRWDRTPDDSSLHLVGALPPANRGQRARRWLDVGTGSAFAPLCRPDLASSVVGVDIDDERIEAARLGLALSGVSHVQLACGDLFPRRLPGGSDGAQHFDLITFNAPLPGHGGDLLDRFFATCRAHLRPGGEVIVHCQLRDGAASPRPLPGEAVTVQYTPAGQRPAFGVTRWRPDEPTRCEHRHVAATARAPFVRRASLEA